MVIFLSIFYFVSLIFYKIGVTRSDGGHLKQGISLCSLILIFLIIYNFTYFLKQKIPLIQNKSMVFKLFNVIIFLVLFLTNLPENFLKNIKYYKQNLNEYMLVEDEFYLTDKEKFLINEIKNLTENEDCFQVFSMKQQ